MTASGPGIWNKSHHSYRKECSTGREKRAQSVGNAQIEEASFKCLIGTYLNVNLELFRNVLGQSVVTASMEVKEFSIQGFVVRVSPCCARGRTDALRTGPRTIQAGAIDKTQQALVQ